jgi:hypothetical protein
LLLFSIWLNKILLVLRSPGTGGFDLLGLDLAFSRGSLAMDLSLVCMYCSFIEEMCMY